MDLEDRYVRWFFIGGLILLGVLVLYTLWKQRKTNAAAMSQGSSFSSGNSVPGSTSGAQVEYVPTTGDTIETINYQSNNPSTTTVNHPSTTTVNNLPTAPAAPPQTPTSTPTTPPPSSGGPGPQPPTQVSVKLGSYVVKSGDSLAKIAAMYHVSGGAASLGNTNNTSLIAEAQKHGIAPTARSRYGSYPAAWDYIYPGQTIQVPGA